MFSGTVWAIVIVGLILAFAFTILAIALHRVAERWAILGAVASVVGAVASVLAIAVSIGIATIQYSGGVNSQSSTSGQTANSAPAIPAPQSQQAEAVPSPGVTSLSSNSPLRKQIPGMDQICGDLGLSQHAWLPGQTSATDLSSRVIFAPGAAYTWSCTESGSKLTRDNITRGCQIWYPGTKAYTWDPNSAYSWVCI